MRQMDNTIVGNTVTDDSGLMEYLYAFVQGKWTSHVGAGPAAIALGRRYPTTLLILPPLYLCIYPTDLSLPLPRPPSYS